MKATKQRSERERASANGLAQDMQEKLQAVSAGRDAFATGLADNKVGARVVNNAEVNALRGRKARLTLLARRTREIRMAFDPPRSLADGTTFTIITPEGRAISGDDPSISMTIDEVNTEPTMVKSSGSSSPFFFLPTRSPHEATCMIYIYTLGSVVMLHLSVDRIPSYSDRPKCTRSLDQLIHDRPVLSLLLSGAIAVVFTTPLPKDPSARFFIAFSSHISRTSSRPGFICVVTLPLR